MFIMYLKHEHTYNHSAVRKPTSLFGGGGVIQTKICHQFGHLIERLPILYFIFENVYAVDTKEIHYCEMNSDRSTIRGVCQKKT